MHEERGRERDHAHMHMHGACMQEREKGGERERERELLQVSSTCMHIHPSCTHLFSLVAQASTLNVCAHTSTPNTPQQVFPTWQLLPRSEVTEELEQEAGTWCQRCRKAMGCCEAPPPLPSPLSCGLLVCCLGCSHTLSPTCLLQVGSTCIHIHPSCTYDASYTCFLQVRYPINRATNAVSS